MVKVHIISLAGADTYVSDGGDDFSEGVNTVWASNDVLLFLQLCPVLEKSKVKYL